MKHQPLDIIGKRIRVGDSVRITGVPDLTGMRPKQIQESMPVFQYLVGKYKKVDRFDKHGFVWLQFSINKGRNRGWHGVAIEPMYLRVSVKM